MFIQYQTNKYQQINKANMKKLQQQQKRQSLLILITLILCTEKLNVQILLSKKSIISLLGKQYEALKLLDQFEKVNPENIDLMWRKGRHKDAIKLTDEILNINPNHINSICRKAQCLFLIFNQFLVSLLRQQEEAIKYVKKGLQIDYKNENLLRIGAKCLTLQGKEKEAIEMINRITTYDIQTYIIKSECLAQVFSFFLKILKLGNKQESLKLIDDALLLNPNNFDLIFKKADLLFCNSILVVIMAQKQYSQALVYIDKVLGNNQKNIDLLWMKGTIQVQFLGECLE